MQDEDFAWPDIADCIAFRDKCYAAVEALIARMPEPREKPVTMDSPYWYGSDRSCDCPVSARLVGCRALFMSFEHERIHLETSSVLIHQLPIDSVIQVRKRLCQIRDVLIRYIAVDRVQPKGWRTAPTFAPSPSQAPANKFVTLDGGSVEIGKPRDFPSFGWCVGDVIITPHVVSHDLAWQG